MNRIRRLAVYAVLVASAAGLALASGPLGGGAPGNAFVGWEGDVYVPPSEDRGSGGGGGGGGGGDEPWVQVVSWEPRAFVYHNFLTEEECEHIKTLAAPQMRRSTVVGEDGKSVEDPYRTSYGTFVKRRSDAVVEAVERRVAHWAQIPEAHSEDMQVLRYGYLQTYKPHMDTLGGDESGPRVATVLLYLSDVEEGGETAFPGSKAWADSSFAKDLGPFSDCTKGGVAVKPKKGDAFLFWSLKPDASTEDPASMHTGCPVLKGVKWTATKWIHAKPFRAETFGVPDPPAPDPGLCQDLSDQCQAWARDGQCRKNAPFMVGDAIAAGHCRASCGACEPCGGPGGSIGAGDLDCYNRNRRAAGFLEVDPSEARYFPALTGSSGGGGSGGGGARGAAVAEQRRR